MGTRNLFLSKHLALKKCSSSSVGLRPENQPWGWEGGGRGAKEPQRGLPNGRTMDGARSTAMLLLHGYGLQDPTLAPIYPPGWGSNPPPTPQHDLRSRKGSAWHLRSLLPSTSDKSAMHPSWEQPPSVCWEAAPTCTHRSTSKARRLPVKQREE